MSTHFRRSPSPQYLDTHRYSPVHQHHLKYTEFYEYPLIISIDRYPREWYYLDLQELPTLGSHHRVLESTDTHYSLEYKDSLEHDPSITRHIAELDRLQRDPSIELPILEERLVFHLLNYDQDIPHIPFHTKRKPLRWHYYDEPAAEIRSESTEVKLSPLPLPRTGLIDSARLMLRDNEFGQFPLEYYLYRRPNTFEWDVYDSETVQPSIEETTTVTVVKEIHLSTVEAGQLLLREEDLHSHSLDHHIHARPATFDYDVLHTHHHRLETNKHNP